MNTTQKNRIIASAQIGDIRLVAMEAKTRIRDPKEAGDKPTVNIACSATIAEPPREDGIFVVIANMDFRITAHEAETEPYFSLVAKFELMYKLPPAFEYTPEELTAFAESNAVFNAWPFFRELIVSTLGRMKLPQFVLPLYRYKQATAKAAVSKE